MEKNNKKIISFLCTIIVVVGVFMMGFLLFFNNEFKVKDNSNVDVSSYAGIGKKVSSITKYQNNHDKELKPTDSNINKILQTIIDGDFEEVSSTKSDGEFDLDNKVIQTEKETITLFYDYQGILVQIVVQENDGSQTAYKLDYSDVTGQISSGRSNEELQQMLQEDMKNATNKQ